MLPAGLPSCAALVERPARVEASLQLKEARHLAPPLLL